jgi:hypothetical protein
LYCTEHKPPSSKLRVCRLSSILRRRQLHRLSTNRGSQVEPSSIELITHNSAFIPKWSSDQGRADSLLGVTWHPWVYLIVEENTKSLPLPLPLPLPLQAAMLLRLQLCNPLYQANSTSFAIQVWHALKAPFSRPGYPLPCCLRRLPDFQHSHPSPLRLSTLPQQRSPRCSWAWFPGP